MKIAVTYENGLVFQHFGKTEEFAIYEFDHDLKLVSKKVTGTMGTSHGALAPFLASLGVDAVICGGLGLPMKEKLVASGIQVFGGVSGNADEAAAALVSGELAFDPMAAENHGDCHHHHEA